MGLGSYRDVEQTVGRRPTLDLATKDSDQVGPQGDEMSRPFFATAADRRTTVTGPPRFSDAGPAAPPRRRHELPGSGPIEFLFEMKRAMERHERGEARVIPIILHPCDRLGPLRQAPGTPEGR